MKTRRLATTPSLAALGALAALACSARTLDVGSTDGGPGTNGSSATGNATGAGGGSTTYTGGCTPASCADQTAGCQSLEGVSPGATPVNLRCAPDPYAGQGSDPAGRCILSFECSVPGASGCPRWTTPGTDTTCSGSGGSCISSATATAFGPGTGVVSLELDPSIGGAPASSTLSAYFTDGNGSGTAAPRTFGACTYDPGGATHVSVGFVPGAPAPNPGAVTATGPTLSVTATPGCDGTYAPAVTGQTFAAGDLLAFGWSPASASGSSPYPTFPAGLPQVPAPHPITLGATDALAAAAPTIARASDLAVMWTTAGTPMALEQVVVLFTQGKAAVTCTFAASAGTGVIPADALLNLNAATAPYRVYSQHTEALKGSAAGWTVSFVAREIAITAGGIAKGSASLQ